MVRWWERPGLEIRDGRLLLAGRDAEELARRHGTPLFVYDLVRIEEQARSLVDAFERDGVPFRLRLAIKAQRDPQVLAFVRQLGAVGIDACSPGEVLCALEHGWAPGEISFTGTNLSERDLDVVLERRVHLNLDLLSQLGRVVERQRVGRGGGVAVRVRPADEVRDLAGAARRRDPYRPCPRARHRHRAHARGRRVPVGRAPAARGGGRADGRHRDSAA